MKSIIINRSIQKLTLILTEHDHVIGSFDAPVTLVEYGDYERPYTADAYPIVKKIQKLLGDKLCFVFRNFPLTKIHSNAYHAAIAAETAASQGRFWEMHHYIQTPRCTF